MMPFSAIPLLFYFTEMDSSLHISLAISLTNLKPQALLPQAPKLALIKFGTGSLL